MIAIFCYAIRLLFASLYFDADVSFRCLLPLIFSIAMLCCRFF